MTPEQDTDLAQRHINGDPQAFATLVDRYQDRLLDFFHRALGNRRRAETLAVEVFVRAFRYIDQFDPATRFSTWLHAIASNVAENDLSSRRRKAARGRWMAAMAEQLSRMLRKRGRLLSRGSDRRIVKRRGALERRRRPAALISSPPS